MDIDELGFGGRCVIVFLCVFCLFCFYCSFVPVWGLMEDFGFLATEFSMCSFQSGSEVLYMTATFMKSLQ